MFAFDFRQDPNFEISDIILLQNQKCHGLCLTAISSAVYRPARTKLGREDGDAHGKDLAGPVSMATGLLP